MHVTVYVPAPDTRLGIDPGSGIVGTHDPATGRIRLDYEGNRHGAVNIINYADRVNIAADRHTTNYPTIARAWVEADHVIAVGSYDTDEGTIDLHPTGPDEDPASLLAAWCGRDPADFNLDYELVTAGNGRHAMARAVREGLRSHDPATRFAAEQMNRRYQLNLP